MIAKEGFPTGMWYGRNDLENDLDAIILPRFYGLGVTYKQIKEQYRHLQWIIRKGDLPKDVIKRVREERLDYLFIRRNTGCTPGLGVQVPAGQ